MTASTPRDVAAATGARQRRSAGGAAASERGAVTVWVLFLAVAILAAAGLVIDGGYALAARRKAMNHAEQAARIGSDELSRAGLRNGQTVVTAGHAHAAAAGYLARVGAAGDVNVAGDRVRVTVHADYHPAILSIVGLSTLEVSASASAVSIDENDNP